MTYDILVIGAGLFGLATSAHIARMRPDLKVALVGPEDHRPDRGVFSSHRDMGRVVRTVGLDACWTRLNVDAQNGFVALEQETGRSIVSRNGTILVSTQAEEKDHYFGSVGSLIDVFSLHGTSMVVRDEATTTRLIERVSPYNAKGLGGKRAIFETGHAGYLSIPQLKAAQLQRFLVKNRGVEVRHYIDDIVTNVRRMHKSESYKVSVASGTALQSKVVVVCAGAFANLPGLLPRAVDIKLKTETVILAHIGQEEASRLLKIPSLLWEDEPSHGDYEGPYLVPPMDYGGSDGWCIKLGANLRHDVFPTHYEQVKEWFTAADTSEQEAVLVHVFQRLLPQVRVNRFSSKKCLLCRTATGKPYVDVVDDLGLFVCVGGNGYGAMCSDAIGKLTASMCLNGAAPQDLRASWLTPSKL